MIEKTDEFIDALRTIERLLTDKKFLYDITNGIHHMGNLEPLVRVNGTKLQRIISDNIDIRCSKLPADTE